MWPSQRAWTKCFRVWRSWAFPPAAALSALTPDQLARAAEVDYALEKWFFNDVLVKNAKDASPSLLFYFRMRADIFDILSICARFLLPNFFEDKEASGYLLAQGSIPLKVLKRSAGSPTLEQALINLRHTPYFEVLRPLLDGKQPSPWRASTSACRDTCGIGSGGSRTATRWASVCRSGLSIKRKGSLNACAILPAASNSD